MGRFEHMSNRKLISIAGVAYAALAILSVEPAKAQWTGCGVGAGGSLTYGLATNGSPVGIGTQGQKAGVSVNCDYRMQAFVVGVEANYDWWFGDAHTLGAKTELSILGRFGVLTNPSNLLYVGAGWGQIDLNSAELNSWKIMFGDEFRIPNSPLYLDLRATYSRYDETDLGFSGPQISSLEAGARLKVKFGPGMFGGKGPMFTDDQPEPRVRSSDPKMPGKP